MSGHAYSFLKFIDANGNYLVKIRNPWGSRIWKGDWSFESNKWSKGLRDKFNYNRCPDDGSFYMSMQDFLKYLQAFKKTLDDCATNSRLNEILKRFSFKISDKLFAAKDNMKKLSIRGTEICHKTLFFNCDSHLITGLN